jgi:hypothetical protein
MLKVALDAPWVTWCKELKALFDRDDDITVSEIYEPENGLDTDYAVAVMVRKHEKFLALDRLLPRMKMFGNVSLGIDLYDEENKEVDVAALFKTLFAGNPIFDSVQTNPDPAGVDWNYVLFKPDVIQFFDDDLTDYNGNWNGLAEELALDIFGENSRGVNFCTALIQ